MRVAKGIVLAACLVFPLVAFAIVAGQVDTFEDGTTQGWIVGGPHPAPPMNVADGGPQGSGDNYLKITSTGGGGPGSRLAVINDSQWAGNYTAAGIAVISMKLRNLGATDLSVRLYLENPMGGPPTDDAVTDFAFLPSGGDWTRVEFAVDPLSLTLLNGSLGALLSNVTALRIIHNPDPSFPPPAIAAMLGIDEIRAESGSPALPLLPMSGAVLLVLLLGVVAALGLRRRAAASSIG